MILPLTMSPEIEEFSNRVAVTALDRPARLCVKAKMNAGPLLERR